MRPDPGWTAGAASIAADEGLHQVVERIALHRPDGAALISGGRVTTYRELNHNADAWAAGLVASGVARADRVAIVLDRGPELVTALLAVLKAGAVYALLDSSWPPHLLRAAAEGMRASLLVTSPGNLSSRDLPLPVWSVPTGPVDVPDGFRPMAVDAADPCCVFFTSGTTGRPKAVLSPHRATARLFQTNSFARFAADTVMPLAAPVPWDAFSLELWSVLLNGGTSLLIDEPYVSGHSLRAAVSGHGTDTVWLTSSLFNMLMDEDPGAFRGLRQIMVGGERLSPGHVRRLLRDSPSTLLLNGYGPVESTVFATTHRVTEADCDRPHGIPLGRPVPGTRVHVLNGSRPCAVGEVGEICIAGDGLAAEYVGDPARTEEVFTEVVIGGRSERVYRSGDLGHWGEDGLLHFRGRADRQVKVRGHRIEAAEVERQVEQALPGVRSCRVVARRDDAGAAVELVAFCVPFEPGDPLEGGVAVVRKALAAHHRPVEVVSVKAFPVTAHGKLDERALLAGVQRSVLPDVQGDHAPAADPTTRLVAETFGAVLGRSPVPPDVPFAELGGSSLGAGRVCARLAARLDRPVPVSQFYRHPTVAGLAGWLRSRPWTGEATPVVGTGTGVPLSPMQLVFLTSELLNPGDRAGYCLLTWVLDGDVDREALEAAVAAVHGRHEPLRAAYLPDPRPMARIVAVGAPEVEVLSAHLSVDAAVAALRTALASGLDLASGEVWRTALVPVGPMSVFGCVVHHIAFDGWSESVLADDLAGAYNAIRQRRSWEGSAAPSLAAVHRRRVAGMAQADLSADRANLVDDLAGVPDLRWPAGETRQEPGPPERMEVRLAPAVVEGLDALAADTAVSRFVVLLSHYAGALAEVTGQRDFAVGVPVAQRAGAGLERAVGCHLTMLGIRLRDAALNGDVTAVGETGRVVRRALAAQDVPYPEVLELLNRPRTGRPPLFQTLFALQNNRIPKLDLDGAHTTFVRQPYLGLPLELHVELWPDEDGGLRLEVAWQPEAVPRPVALELTGRYTDSLHAAAEGRS
ncbi:amino acid adenylation domain-containing protein [Streptomyces sp. NPDC094034]|uniref:amino acid adenylation domain-containing protein n=1 Tax=Streptomyces sp. NPDC094034 TaxID=3155309 RepID=UPI0033322F8D